MHRKTDFTVDCGNLSVKWRDDNVFILAAETRCMLLLWYYVGYWAIEEYDNGLLTPVVE